MNQRTLNQQRLIDQNKKLNEEVLKLESQVGKVIGDNVIETYERRHSQKSTKREELSLQAGYMKKLKNKLAQMKGLKSYDRGEDVRREKDHVHSLKKEFDTYQTEKELLQKVFVQKKQALDFNRPLEGVKTQTETRLSKVRQENGSLNSDLLCLEREIRKHHQNKELNRCYRDQKIVVSNYEVEANRLDQEIKSWDRRTKAVEDRWRPQFDNLDKEFLSMKEIMSRKERVMGEAEK